MSTTALMLPDFALALGPKVWRMSFFTSAEFAAPPWPAAWSPEDLSLPPQPTSRATSSTDTTPVKVLAGTAPPQVRRGRRARVYGADVPACAMQWHDFARGALRCPP